MSPVPKDQVPLIIYQQNICGLRGKVNELISQLYPTLPHILCLSEHHMTDCELQMTYLGNYKLGSSYCRRMYEMGGVCIYIQENLKYICLNLEAYCQDKTIEVCTIKVNLGTKNICVIAIYRAPIGNFELFLLKLDTVLRNLYTTTVDFILVGDINVDYMINNDRKSKLDALLKSYNMVSIINFPTVYRKTQLQPLIILLLTSQK
jgi:exonuclease III